MSNASASPLSPSGTSLPLPLVSASPKGVTQPLRPPASRRTLLIVVAGILAALGAAWGAHAWWAAGRYVRSTDDAFVGGDITVIASKVPGFIAEVAVTDNQSVHAGDLLVRIDDRDFRAALDRACASVAGEEATLANLDAKRRLQQALIAESEAEVAAADAEIVRAGDNDERYRQLSAYSATSVQTYQEADANFKKAVAGGAGAKAALEASRLQLEVIETQKRQTNAALAGAAAERETARLNLAYTEIRSPVDGTVGNRSARTGAYASTGAQLASIVPARGLWIDANFKESQIAAMQPGQPATIRAEVLPGEVFHGHVVSLAPATGAQFSVLPAENATGNFTKIVQRVPVRIALDGDGALLGKLRPGLSVTVKVDEAPAAEGAP